MGWKGPLEVYSRIQSRASFKARAHCSGPPDLLFCKLPLTWLPSRKRKRTGLDIPNCHPLLSASLLVSQPETQKVRFSCLFNSLYPTLLWRCQRQKREKIRVRRLLKALCFNIIRVNTVAKTIDLTLDIFTEVFIFSQLKPTECFLKKQMSVFLFPDKLSCRSICSSLTDPTLLFKLNNKYLLT